MIDDKRREFQLLVPLFGSVVRETGKPLADAEENLGAAPSPFGLPIPLSLEFGTTSHPTFKK